MLAILINILHKTRKSQMLLLLILCLWKASADLTEDRLANAKLWIDRSHSGTDMEIGYGETVTSEGVCHSVQTVGSFCGRDIAKEYDSVVLVIEILGSIAPVKVWTMWDQSTTRWVTTDVLIANFEMNITVAYDFVLGDYLVKNQTARLTEYITFQSNSSLITMGYTVHDASANKMFALAESLIPSDILCAGIIFPACNVSTGVGSNTYLPDTGFSTVGECIAFIDSLPAKSLCPYQSRSQTAACRALHGTSAFILPSLHCAHVRPVSMVCTDSCLPACANCHANAECIATHPGIPTNFTDVYECKCKNGYLGNGSVCVEKTCEYGNCPALYGSYDCTTGLCKCTETFIAQPEGFGSNGLCVCPDGGQIVYNNSKPVCVPVGKCISEKWECNLQPYNRVSCQKYGNNTFSLLKDCICHYGFKGGFEYNCICESPKRVLWSDTFNGEVCLSTIECTANWHCVYPKTCSISTGQQIGSCV